MSFFLRLFRRRKIPGSSEEYQYHKHYLKKAKVLICGTELVGKSSFIGDCLGIDVQKTISEPQHFYHMIRSLHGPLRLDFCTCSTQFIPATVPNTEVVILVFSLVDKNSYEAIPELVQLLLNNTSYEEMKFCVVGMKKDLEDERVVSREEVEAYVRDNNYLFYAEASIFDHESISDVFERIIEYLTSIEKVSMREVVLKYE